MHIVNVLKHAMCAMYVFIYESEEDLDINSLNLFDETNKNQEDNEVQTGKTLCDRTDFSKCS